MSPPENSATPPALHELESEVVEAVWDRGRSTVREIMEVLNRRASKPRAYTTYMTIMARLDAKGLLTRERQGKTDLYSPVLTREAYVDARAHAEVGALVEQFGEVALVHFAREMDKLDAKRRQQLRRLARRA